LAPTRNRCRRPIPGSRASAPLGLDPHFSTTSRSSRAAARLRDPFSDSASCTARPPRDCRCSGRWTRARSAASPAGSANGPAHHCITIYRPRPPMRSNAIPKSSISLSPLQFCACARILPRGGHRDEPSESKSRAIPTPARSGQTDLLGPSRSQTRTDYPTPH